MSMVLFSASCAVCCFAMALWGADSAAGRQDPPAAAGGPQKPAPSAEEFAATLERAIRNVADEAKYRLQYALPGGEVFEWDCEQSTSTKTRMSGQFESSSTRTQWRSRWEAGPPDTAGNMRVQTRVEWFTLWQQIDERPPVVFDSRKSEEVPEEFLAIADKVLPRGAGYLISPAGRVLRQDSSEKRPAGLPDVTIPLPEEPVAVGTRWFESKELAIRDEDRSVVRVAIRTEWQLTKVVEGRAYLTFRTVILSPGISATVRSQLMQNMSRGYVVFDMARGIPVLRETDWNDRVQSFATADSFVEYVARMTERLRPVSAVAASATPRGEQTMTVAPGGQGPLTGDRPEAPPSNALQPQPATTDPSPAGRSGADDR